MSFRVEQQKHGYRSGHQLLAATVKLSREDQDIVDRLSDLAGPLRPGETFLPYITMYPLPSNRYYVVARTWQDLSTPRAGCVITRSLLVPMNPWSESGNIASLLSFLASMDEPTEYLEVPTGQANIQPPVFEPRIIELVEALFLEKRRPIVFFESNDAELIATRLLMAVWPSLRKSLAISTFALSPRRLEGRDFDIVFAPKSARTRFSDWEGRRIEVGTAERSRHRWSEKMAAHIFEAPVPSLAADDALGFLSDSDRNDESALRITLLWNELIDKLESSPTAILGLLDILNTRSEKASARYGLLEGRLEPAVAAAVRNFPPDDAWIFLDTLLAKFQDAALPSHFASVFTQNAEQLTAKSAQTALRYISTQKDGHKSASDILVQGVAAGLRSSHVFSDDNLSNVLTARALGDLLAADQQFAKNTLFDSKNVKGEAISQLTKAIELARLEALPAIRRNVICYLDDKAFAPLILPLMRKISAEDLEAHILQIGRTTEFEIQEFDEPLRRSIDNTGSVRNSQIAVLENFKSSGSDRFVLAISKPTADEITWLTSEMRGERTDQIAVRLIEQTSTSSLDAMLTTKEAQEAVLSLLERTLPNSAEQILRVLETGRINLNASINIGIKVLDVLPSGPRNALAVRLLGRALREAELRDERVRPLINKANVDSRKLIELATDRSISSSRLAENVVFISSASESVRKGIEQHIDYFCDRVLRHSNRKMTEEAYGAWADLISSSKIDGAKFRGATETLSFALKKPQWPVSALVVAAFPFVHTVLRRVNEEDTLPAILAIPLSFLRELDRAKSLRYQLVEAFKESNWPPEALIFTAINADILEKVLGILARNSSGMRYLHKIEQAVDRLSPSIKNTVRAALYKHTNY